MVITRTNFRMVSCLAAPVLPRSQLGKFRGTQHTIPRAVEGSGSEMPRQAALFSRSMGECAYVKARWLIPWSRPKVVADCSLMRLSALLGQIGAVGA